MKLHIKMDKKTIKKSDDIEIRKENFHQHKSPILINNIDINKILVSNKISFSKKDLHAYFFWKWARIERLWWN